jgi:hypothetical protein
MRTSLFQKVLSCFMSVIMPAALFAVDTGGAMLYAHGPTSLNGSNVPKSTAIFAGDLVQTNADSVANITASGSIVRILSDSLVQFEGTAVKLERGGVAVSTSKAMGAKAGRVTVSPAATSGWTEFEVKDVDGTVQIAARKGDLTINDDSGTSTLPQGQQTTRDESDTHNNRTKPAAGTAPAAVGGLLDHPVAIGIATGAILGVTAWVLAQGDEPLSPAKP